MNAPSGEPGNGTGWFQGVDGAWYQSDEPPAPGWWLADDGRWYQPAPAAAAAPAATHAVAAGEPAPSRSRTPRREIIAAVALVVLFGGGLAVSWYLLNSSTPVAKTFHELPVATPGIAKLNIDWDAYGQSYGGGYNLLLEAKSGRVIEYTDQADGPYLSLRSNGSGSPTLPTWLSSDACTLSTFIKQNGLTVDPPPQWESTTKKSIDLANETKDRADREPYPPFTLAAVEQLCAADGG